MFQARRAIRIKLVHNKQKGPDPMWTPWAETDIISRNCPKHTGIQLFRNGDNVFECPTGGEVYKPYGSIANQTSRDNHYMGVTIKGPAEA